jgi:hypothetical protein
MLAESHFPPGNCCGSAVQRLRISDEKTPALQHQPVQDVRRDQELHPRPADGVPGLPNAEGIWNIIEYHVRIPLKISEPLPPEKIMDLRLIEKVKKEFATKTPGR